MKNEDKNVKDKYNLEVIGNSFGKAIADLVGRNRESTVTILSVDETHAYVTMNGGDELEEPVPMSVPLTGMNISNSAFTAIPAVGSLSVIALADGEDSQPYFVAHSQIDTFRFERGATVFQWKITPPDIDDNGDEIEGETEDEITLAIGETTLRVVEEEIALVLGESSLRVDTDVCEFNGGGLGGLLLLAETVEKLNDLEAGYNDLVAKYNAHIHITTATVGATPTPGIIAPTTSVEPTVLVPTQPADIENIKITQ